MFQHILVPLDGSRHAEQALSIAAYVAKASGGTIILLQVVNTLSEVVSSPTRQSIPVRPFIHEDLAKARHYLQQCVERENLADISHILIVRKSPPTDTILHVIDEQAVDLVVMDSHGYTGMTHWLLGSMVQNISSVAPVPVLLLHEEHSLPIDDLVRREDSLRFLVPLDGSSQAEEAIIPAAQLVMAMAAPERGALHLLSVRDGQDTNGSMERRWSIRQAKEYLRATVRCIREGCLSGPIATGRLLLTWSVSTSELESADAIVRMAEHGQISMVLAPICNSGGTGNSFALMS